MAVQRRRGAALFLLALIMGPRALLAQAASQEESGGDDARSPSQRLHRAMLAAIQEMQEMKPCGDVDRDFAQIMCMYHRQVVAMAKEQLATGRSSEMKTLARAILEDQRRKIAQLEFWLASRP